MDIDSGFEDLGFKVHDIRLESKAAANAIRALQDRIQVLETDKDNMQNHIDFLVQNNPALSSKDFYTHSRSSSKNLSDPGDGDKLISNLEAVLSKAEFLEQELRRKEQQFCIDRENWELERKMLRKELAGLRGKAAKGGNGAKGGRLDVKGLATAKGKVYGALEKADKGEKGEKGEKWEKVDKSRIGEKRISEKVGKGNTPGDPRVGTERSEDLDNVQNRLSPRSTQDLKQYSIYEDKIFSLSQKLKESEYHRYQIEEILQKSRKNYEANIDTIESELVCLKKSSNPEAYIQEINSLKKIIQSQNNEIEKLTFDLNELKINYLKLEELSQFLKKEPPKFELRQRPAKELEEAVERLNAKYKDLLQRTRRQDENYSELRNELRQTAFDLEYQSFLLFQQRKPESEF